MSKRTITIAFLAAALTVSQDILERKTLAATAIGTEFPRA